MAAHIWTDRQFDAMSWHDNHVHAIRIVEGVHGTGQLILDLDYILEWLQREGSKFKFRVVPVALTFRGVTNLRISLDYATPGAALGPFSIQAIERHLKRRDRYEAQLWKILVNWPLGEISFEADGYEQRSTGDEVLSEAQALGISAR